MADEHADERLDAVERVDGPVTLPLVWRTPLWQVAALILLATVLFAVDLYGSLSLGPLVLTIGIAAAALVGAVFAIRLVLVADEDGIWVRRLFTTTLVEWPDVGDVYTVPVSKNNMTIRIERRGGGHVEIPPSLLLPAVPTGVKVARTRVHMLSLQLARIAADRRTV